MNSRPLWVLVLLAVALASGGLSVIKVGPVPSPVPVEPAKPAILSGVSASDAAQLRAFYEAMADIVVRDGSAKKPVVATTLELRNRHEGALSMAFASTGMVGKYPGLGDRLDAHLLSAIGDTDLPLDSGLRQKAAEAFLQVK